MPEVSVIVPVYNAEQYLHRCVDSILSQTFKDFELILIDDGSLDGSSDICDQYEKSDARIKVIHQKNQGQACARNRGTEQAKGRWITFIDSDDLIHPQYLQALYTGVKMNHANISMCAAIEDNEIPDSFLGEKKISVEYFEVNEETIQWLLQEGKYRYWTVWGKMIRKDILNRLPLDCGKIYEDNAIVCKWLVDAQIVANIQENLYFYYVNKEGTTKSAFNIKRLDYLWALLENIQFYEQMQWKNMTQEMVFRYWMASANYYRIVKKELKNKNLAKKIKKDAMYMKKKYPQVSLKESEELYINSIFYPKRTRLKQGIKKISRFIRKGICKS